MMSRVSQRASNTVCDLMPVFGLRSGEEFMSFRSNFPYIVPTAHGSWYCEVNLRMQHADKETQYAPGLDH